jgi:DNA-directed RNA polymerase subunit RPC12/RpoP
MSRSDRWKLACPECENDDMVHSSRPRPSDWLSMLMGKRPYRCYWCGARFLSGGSPERLPAAPRETSSALGEVRAACPNCGGVTKLMLGMDEQNRLQTDGWYVSCAQCSAAYVFRPGSAATNA